MYISVQTNNTACGIYDNSVVCVCVCLWFPQAGLHKLELNPYWKDGGSGLPPVEMAGSAAKKGKNRDQSVEACPGVRQQNVFQLCEKCHKH